MQRSHEPACALCRHVRLCTPEPCIQNSGSELDDALVIEIQPREVIRVDNFTRNRLAQEQALQQAHRENIAREQARMAGAAALENAKRAQEAANRAAAERRALQDSQNRAQGLRNNW